MHCGVCDAGRSGLGSAGQRKAFEWYSACIGNLANAHLGMKWTGFRPQERKVLADSLKTLGLHRWPQQYLSRRLPHAQLDSTTSHL